jgi:hypothetical protein
MCASLLVLLAAFAATAALPPLGPERLAADAKLVVTGTVRSASSLTVRAEPGTDLVSMLDVEVETVEKGSGAAAGETIRVRCWTIDERPAGWVGPSGHGGIPPVGARVRLWLVPQGKGQWAPLEPNGIEVLGAELEEGDDD